jgi:hypothetical protein
MKNGRIIGNFPQAALFMSELAEIAGRCSGLD